MAVDEPLLMEGEIGVDDDEGLMEGSIMVCRVVWSCSSFLQ